MGIQYSKSTPREDLGIALHQFDAAEAGFIATRILPLRAVRKIKANIAQIQRENWTKATRTKRQAGGAFPRVHMRAEDTSYSCELYGLEAPLADEDRAQYEDEFDAELELTGLINQMLLWDLELEVKDLIFNTTTWSGTSLYTDTSTDWDNAASDIIGDIEGAKEYVRKNSGGIANALIISAATLVNMKKNTAIKARFPGIGALTEDVLVSNLPAIFGLPQIIVGGKVYNSADEGQTFTSADIWPDDYAMICRVNSPGDSLWTPGLGRTFAWSPVASDILATDQYREEQTKSDIFRVEHAVDPVVLNKYCGHLLLIDA